jgi:leucyl aminopeptidase
MSTARPRNPVKVTVHTAGAAADLYGIGVFENEAPAVDALPAGAAAIVARLSAAGFQGQVDGVRQALLPNGAVLLLLGLGRREAADSRTITEAVRSMWAAACTSGARTLAIGLPDFDLEGFASAEALAREVLVAGYRFEQFLSKSAPEPAPREVKLLVSGDGKAVRAATAAASPVARAIVYARDLANTPPNRATPRFMAAQARALARRHGMRVQVLGPRELAAKGMGGILAVGSGSAEPPRLVRLEWGKGPLTVALVGKGVTFDTGGISIKPAAAMDEMKYDKAGACTVLAVMAAAAESRLPLRLRAYLPLVENMPGAASYRPGDIIRCHNGKTVEIINTDAEGRLILADALSWAASEKPDAMLAYATLTGACVVALGNTGAGLFTPQDGLAAELLAAAGRSGERLWRLPLWPEFAADMKGSHGDLRNQGSRWGGASNAAAFLSFFVRGVARWAHFDIAGPAYVGADGHGPKGATGWGVATTIAWLKTLR